ARWTWSSPIPKPAARGRHSASPTSSSSAAATSPGDWTSTAAPAPTSARRAQSHASAASRISGKSAKTAASGNARLLDVVHPTVLLEPLDPLVHESRVIHVFRQDGEHVVRALRPGLRFELLRVREVGLDLSPQAERLVHRFLPALQRLGGELARLLV